jgi:hypothetical protein
MGEIVDLEKMGIDFIVVSSLIELHNLLSDKSQDLNAVNLMAKSIIPKLTESIEHNPVRTLTLARILWPSMNLEGKTRKDVKKTLEGINDLFVLIKDGEGNKNDIKKAMEFCQSFCRHCPIEENFRLLV